MIRLTLARRPSGVIEICSRYNSQGVAFDATRGLQSGRRSSGTLVPAASVPCQLRKTEATTQSALASPFKATAEAFSLRPGASAAALAARAAAKPIDRHDLVFERVESGAFPLILVTGAAGTGKSHLLKRIAALPQTLVVAPSGIAALAVEGQTIHRAMNLEIGVLDAMNLKEMRSETLSVLKHIHRLVIDEVSMVRADLLDAVDARLRQAHGTRQPFGAVPVVMFGDPFQLPPVAKPDELVLLSDKLSYPSCHFFAARVMTEAPPLHVELKRQYRQDRDATFLGILNRMRTGEHRGDDIAKLNTRVRPPSLHSPNAIYLAARNDAADAINRRRLAALPGSAMFSVAETTWPVSDTPAETRLELRRGARVVVLRNDASDRYANGSRGTVESWNTEGVSLTLDENGSTVVLARHTWEYREVFFNEEEDEIQSRVIGTFTQIPLRLGWALSIHKSQGMTLGDIVVDLGTGAFAAGQTYVALSRAKSLSNIVLAKRIIASDVRVDPLVLAYFLALRTSGAGHV